MFALMRRCFGLRGKGSWSWEELGRDGRGYLYSKEVLDEKFVPESA